MLAITGYAGNLKKKNPAIKTIVIDAGHGGHDPGCHGRKGKEKEVTLSVALKLGKLISENHPDVKVVYTREKDEFIELHERANIANRNHADLFISIHCNSGKSNAYGVETFSMGLHRSADNLDVAKRENESVLLEKDYKTKYDGFDPNSPEASIIFTLYQNAFLEQSLTIASLVQDEFREVDKRFDRGVKQAGFLVLVYTAMPSILIETGFLTNPEDERLMVTDKGQLKIAESIYRAFRKYKGDLDDVKINEGKRDELKQDNKLEEKPKDNLYKKPISNKPVPSDVKQVEDSTKIFDTVQSKRALNNEPENTKESAVTYKVQFSSSDKKIPLTSNQFKQLKGVSEYVENGMYKYTVGNFNDFNEAMNLQKEIRTNGFKEAFVVAFKDGKRINMKDALLLQKK
ncbi:MAG: N-acetylmuramoyl-L-alanine amidase [Bacteroidetes bacterium]|nr:N-acetylmuramoyl-L-alanine amidase [Bacteroidota bacterium]MBK9672508.1 N-acetylmuramoyl-L-alanine amidase [Bacteroidota bacterium]MBK9799798.1 N-acetylmuramoyl-L-alanine amidase [Bacteroidota bacterium]